MNFFSTILPWLWAIPGIGLALVTFWLVSKFFGLKVGIFAALGVIATSVVKVFSAAQRKKGREEYERQQLQENADAATRANAARERERERQRTNPDGLREDDGFRRD